MITFKSIDSIEIPGRGVVFIVENWQKQRESELRQLIGEIVIIDNTQYIVKGFESWLLAGDPIIESGDSIGLLVSQKNKAR